MIDILSHFTINFFQVSANFNKKQSTKTTKWLRAIFEDAIDCMIIVNDRGVIELINPAGIRLFQYEAEELVGQKINLLMPAAYPETQDTYRKHHQEKQVPKAIGINRVDVAQKKDGTIFPIRLSINEVELEHQIIYTGIIRDLSLQKAAEEKTLSMKEELESIVLRQSEKLSKTIAELSASNKSLKREIRERKEAEETIRQQEVELRQLLTEERELTALKSKFITMASHQFRTPLSTILSSAELIEKYELNQEQEKREKHVHRIRQSVANLSGMLNDFFSVKKLEDGKIENRPVHFKFHDLTESLQQELQQLLKPGQLLICNDRTEDIDITLDQYLLKTVLRNLLSNAIKYSNDYQTISCQSDIVNEQLHIEVKDHGIGIPEKAVPHVFERFYRASNADNMQGTGLGLFIVKRYVELMGGSITVSSELFRGSTFKLTFNLK